MKLLAECNLAKMKALAYSISFATRCLGASAHVGSPRDQPSTQDLVVERAVGQYQTYKSSNVTNPELQITKSGAALAPGYLFFIPATSGDTVTPLIMTDDGELVWSGNPQESMNLHVSQLDGVTVISYWSGYLASIGYGYGAVKILDTTYSELYTICPKFGLHVPNFDAGQPKIDCEGDLHESEITSDNTLIVSAYNVTQTNLTSVNGPANGWAVDSQFHEIDVKTGAVLFSWKSLDHVPITESLIPIGFDGNSGNQDTDPYDYFHINSIDKVAGGRYLVDSRHTSAMYLVDADGSIIWTFNGYNGGDFTLPQRADNLSHFGFQHHAEVKSMDGDVTVLHIFNNNTHENEDVIRESSGMEFRLDTATNKSTLLRRLHDPNQKIESIAEGSYFLLANEHVLVGYGTESYFKEFGPKNDTDVRMTVQFGDGIACYRAYKQEWSATPAKAPDVVAHPKDGLGYVSWNGVTDVTSYAIYAGQTKKALRKAATVDKDGFETQFDLPNGNKTGGFIQVGAFNGKTLLRKSAIILVKDKR